MNLYTHAEWVRFREEIIKLDDGRCVRCGRSRTDGVVLQVHHKSYAPGRRPWEYAYTECETLCKGCHAQEHGIIMPLSDWELVGSDDLGALIGNCELCGTELQYIYAVIHPKWGSLAVGTYCCDRLTLTTAASEHHRKHIKVRDRRARFLSSTRWKERSGEWRITQKGIAVCISACNDKFIVSMNGARGKIEYASIFDAKLKVLDVIDSGKAPEFLERRRAKLSQSWHQQ